MKIFINILAVIATIFVMFQVVPTLLSSGDPVYMIIGLMLVVAFVAYLISKVKNEQNH